MGIGWDGVRHIVTAGLLATLLAAGLGAPALAEADVCVSSRGKQRVDKGSSECVSDATSHAVAVKDSIAVALNDSHATAIKGSEAFARNDSDAHARDGCTVVASSGRRLQCP